MALVAGGVVVAGVSEVLTGAISVLAFLLLLSLEKTPPIASPPTIRAISTTAASAIHGAREAPPWRPGGPPTGPPARPRPPASRRPGGREARRRARRRRPAARRRTAGRAAAAKVAAAASAV